MIHKVPFICCDSKVCDAHAAAWYGATVPVARAYFREQGWQRRQGKDYCPSHATEGLKSETSRLRARAKRDGCSNSGSDQR